ncbi:hypothetical protein HK099_000967, partial [Clydaea vesicula]
WDSKGLKSENLEVPPTESVTLLNPETPEPVPLTWMLLFSEEKFLSSISDFSLVFT